MDRHTIEQILPLVTKPSRYIGNEWNMVKKDWDKTPVKMAFAFPDVYEVGMSHLGLRILYSLINDREDTLLERVFAPWVDMEAEMRARNIPLFALESLKPIGEFDLLGFTLQYEMSFTNILNMLDLAGIPLRSKDRTEQDPIVMAGGPVAFTPEPIADFIDFFVIGEGEEVIHEVLDQVKEWKEKGGSKETLLESLAKLGGIYVPRFYDVDYDEAGKLVSIKPNRPGLPAKVTKRLIKDFDKIPFPTKPLVPFSEVVHDRIMLEVLRGCSRGCRFCQAGMLYRPVREKSPETLLQQAKELVEHTGYNEISLTSLSTSDYSCVGGVVEELLNRYEEENIGVSLPSLRVDSFSVDLAGQVQRVRKTGLTFAPEAGSQRLRDVINKGVSEENLVEAVTGAFKHGWTRVKLYFMIGLPTETMEDVEGIGNLAKEVVSIGNKARAGQKGKPIQVTVSASSFVPKAHTPFQWEPQDSMDLLKEKQNHLRELIKKDRKISFNYHDAQLSFVEAVFARGDRRLGDLLEKAWQMGCKFDGWSEHFRFDTWMSAFEAVGIDPESYARRKFEYEDTLPWDHIDSGVSKEFLIREHKRAMESAITQDCRFATCHACKLCPDLDVAIDLKGGDR